MKCPEPTIKEGIIIALIACLFLMALSQGSGERLPAGQDFRVASR